MIHSSVDLIQIYIRDLKSWDFMLETLASQCTLYLFFIFLYKYITDSAPLCIPISLLIQSATKIKKRSQYKRPNPNRKMARKNV